MVKVGDRIVASGNACKVGEIADKLSPIHGPIMRQQDGASSAMLVWLRMGRRGKRSPCDDCEHCNDWEAHDIESRNPEKSLVSRRDRVRPSALITHLVLER